MTTVRIDEATLFGGPELGLIAGPCVIESREHCLRMAESIARVASRHPVALVFKASFDKANRTSRDSYRGPGIDEGLRILEEVRDRFGVPVLSDVHEVGQVAAVAEVVDVVQIPAFLCRQTDLVEAAAASGRAVNVKKGQFLAPWDMSNVIDKVVACGNERLLLTERGVSFGYNNLVVDFKGVAMLAGLGYPVVLDVTHSLQLPAGEGGRTGGQREYAEPLARAGVAAGVDALFLEVHDDPDRALSDASTQLPLDRFEPMLRKVLRIRAAIMEDS